MPVVVVESPAKAKTINQYLGDDYTVIASYGHVRDLPPKDGSVDPDRGFEMIWEVASESKKHVKAIADALKRDSSLILATDPDREGEAISWHLQEELRGKRGIGSDIKISRVAFNAITRNAVTEAMNNPRQVDTNLVDSYLARRALDYLVGFTLSPVLWRKLPGARSAGRVQSVCLRLIVDREMEIEKFDPQEYWSVRATFETPRGESFEAQLRALDGKRLGKYEPADAAGAEDALRTVAGGDFAIASVEAKPVTRNPAPPFMTSTLQQEASRKFGFGARQTMSLAQRLYEAGRITYMRTDGIDMAPEAVQAARRTIGERYGDSYLPERPRIYKNKAKNAQEAHECIRPTEMSRHVGSLDIPDPDQRKLYELIWKRALASQMAAARLERTTVDIAGSVRGAELRATGQVVKFDGFLKVYQEGRDEAPDSDDKDDNEEKRLPHIVQGEEAKFAQGGQESAFAKALGVESALVEFDAAAAAEAGVVRENGIHRHDAALLSDQGSVLAQRHYTKPQPRYTEATLVKKMEELGIGRPSTYASIVTTIQDRGYVRKEGKALIPEDKGRLVTIFLTSYFEKYVGYKFTAGLEEQLDDITAGDQNYKDVLDGFWRDFKTHVDQTSELRIGEVLEKIDEMLAPHLYPESVDGTDPRICPHCSEGRLSTRTARAGGAFIGCSRYPECKFIRPFGPPGMDRSEGIGPDGEELGMDGGDSITIRHGRFGHYVQRGEPTDDQPKPPRASLPKGWSVKDVDLEKALMLLNLPREIGPHPEDGEVVVASLGRFGPYVKHGRVYANLADAEEVFEIGMNRAVDLLAQKKLGWNSRGSAPPLKELGEHPGEGGPIRVMNGRYGPYVKWSKINATLPRDVEPETVTMELALSLIEQKAAKGTKKRKAPVGKSATGKKSATKENAAAGKKAATVKKSTKQTATGKTTAKGKSASSKSGNVAASKRAGKRKSANDEAPALLE